MRYFILLVFAEFFSTKGPANVLVNFKTFEELIDQSQSIFFWTVKNET